MRLIILLSAVAAIVLAPAPQLASAQDPRVIEVVEVDGIIDAAVEGAIERTLETAIEEDAELVVLQIDSAGTLGAERARRLVDLLVSNREVPVMTWIGPSGAVASNGAALLALAGNIRAMAPGAMIGPVEVLDLRAPVVHQEQVEGATLLLRDTGVEKGISLQSLFSVAVGDLTAEVAEDRGLVHLVAPQLPKLLEEIDGERVGEMVLRVDPDEVRPRFRKPDLWGRLLHAVAQPSIAYLLLLLGLVGVVFEVFHPSTGPAGASGAIGLALAGYGVAALGGSWLGVGLIVLGVVGFSVDLRVAGLGVFTLLGFGGLVVGSLILFRAPWLRVSPWVLALGIVGMTAFMLGAMTRVLRDLRAIARGELEVRDPHPHPEEEEEEEEEAEEPQRREEPKMHPEERLAELGLSLPEAAKPVAAYVPTVRTGDLVYVSGQGPWRDEPWRGKVGDGVTLDEAKDAARSTCLYGLAALKQEIGDLDLVRRVVRLGVFVASAPGFSDQPVVANGASELLVDVFGARGRHTRAAVGVAELPMGIPVEIEFLFEVG